jgi:hypothetical protein
MVNRASSYKYRQEGSVRFFGRELLAFSLACPKEQHTFAAAEDARPDPVISVARLVLLQFMFAPKLA